MNSRFRYISIPMFANSMDIDCSLEEFATVLVANGYINDESCFTDADIPSIISAFENPDVLVSPEAYPISPYNNGDLSRLLEMAQIANRSLYESCLPDNFVHHDVASVHDINSSRTHEYCKINPVLNSPIQSLAASLSCSDTTCSSDLYLNSNFTRHPVSLNFNISDSKDEEVVKTIFPINSNQVHYSVDSHFKRDSNDIHDSSNLHDHDVLHPKCSLGKIDSFSQNSTQNPLESLLPRAKQKRRRRSKGYSKPTKSRTKKMKRKTEAQSQPRAKKQRLVKDILQQEGSSQEGRNVIKECEDILQDDSGFESGDKIMCQPAISGSQPVVSSIIDSQPVVSSVSGSSEAVTLDTVSELIGIGEANKSLRRSSRATRNTENYNFRLSSLVKRVETERRQQEPRQPKDKSKPAPLSKYRRRTANARERDRMKEINDAFDNLKNSLPSIETDDSKQKVTKFTILKHALNYIASLRDMLNYEPVLSSHDDDVSSDFSSIRPASVTSSGGDDSCSSPTSSHSVTNTCNKGIPSFWVTDHDTRLEHLQTIEVFPNSALVTSTL